MVKIERSKKTSSPSSESSLPEDMEFATVPPGSSVPARPVEKRNQRMSIRLAELLDYTPDRKRRPGVIRHIVEHTGLDRHQVSSLLKNDVKYIPLDTLAILCDYLIEHRGIPAQVLPGALFCVAPDSFWEMLARRRVELVTGVRKPKEDEWSDGALIMASDALLQGELLTGISTLGGAAKYASPSMIKTVAAEGDELEPSLPPAARAARTESLRQSFVWAPPRGLTEVDQSRAYEVYKPFEDRQGDRGMICIGSHKSNPVTEIVIAKMFHCDPFRSEDDVATASARSVPFMFRYRPEDPHPNSCVGGSRLSRSEEAVQNGIWYETEDGTWKVSPWTAPRHDVALVLYSFCEGTGLLEMVAAGYSGRSSRLLARTLPGIANQLWPAQTESHGTKLGAFIIEYEFEQEDSLTRDILRTELNLKPIRVIPLSPAVFERRFTSSEGEGPARKPLPR